MTTSKNGSATLQDQPFVRKREINRIKKPLITDKVGSNQMTQTVSLGTFAEDIFDTLHIPVEIQRREAWKAPRKRSYICSLFAGVATTDLTVVDMEKCLAYVTATGDDASADYFRSIINTQNKPNILLDGGNRSKTIIQFMRDELSYTGDIVYKDDETGEYDTQYVINKKYSKLPESTREYFANKAAMSIKHITKSNQQNLHLMFKAMNQVVALNYQELRNATLSPIADCVRESVKYDLSCNDDFSLLTTIPTIKDHDRMKDDEFIAHLYTWERNGTATSLKYDVIDDLYDSHLTDAEAEVLKDGVDDKMDILREVFSNVSVKERKRSKVYGFLIFLDILEELHGIPKNYNLNNLYDHFTAMDEYLLKDARRRVLEEEVEEKKTYLYTRREMVRQETLKEWKASLLKAVTSPADPSSYALLKQLKKLSKKSA